MSICLVLEGGAMRGVFTAGVLDFFLEKKIEPDACIGVSAGACLACSFLCKQKGRGFAVMTDYLDNKDYCSISSLIRTGDLFGADFLYHKIPEELYPIDNESFHAGKSAFYSVVTNVDSGKPEYYRINDMFDDVDAVRASSSLPLVARMVELKGKMYLDGGVSDPIPVKKALEMGFDKVIVVLTRYRSFRKSKEKTIPLIRMKYRDYPALVEAMTKRHRVYNESLDLVEKLEEEGKIFVISPREPLRISRTEKNMDLLRDGYHQGHSVAEKVFPQLMEYLID